MKIRTILGTAVAAGTLFLAGCEDLADGIYEMAVGEDLQITTTEAPEAELGAEYEWYVSAEVKNDPHDELYDYDWKLVRGTLPEGLLFSDEGRRALVSGVPEETGSFDITLRVSSDRLREEELKGEDSHVWSSSDLKSFTLVVEER